MISDDYMLLKLTQKYWSFGVNKRQVEGHKTIRWFHIHLMIIVYMSVKIAKFISTLFGIGNHEKL